MKFTPFFIFFFCLTAQARLIDKTAAQVNSDVVLLSDISTFKKNLTLRKEIDPFIGLTGISFAENKEILDYLVQEKLVLQKFNVTEEEAEEEINAVQRNNKIDREQLKSVLTSQGVKFSDYKKLMLVSAAKRKLVDRELRPLAAVTDEEVKNFYYTDSSTRSARKGENLVLSYSLRQLILPNSHLSEAASKRLNNGEDFDSVASELSTNGAELTNLGMISEENMNSKIRDAIQGLKVGEVTKPLSTGSGYMILKITEIGAPKDPIFEREKERIRGTLFQKALQNQLRIWTDKERSLSYISMS